MTADPFAVFERPPAGGSTRRPSATGPESPRNHSAAFHTLLQPPDPSVSRGKTDTQTEPLRERVRDAAPESRCSDARADEPLEPDRQALQDARSAAGPQHEAAHDPAERAARDTPEPESAATETENAGDQPDAAAAVDPSAAERANDTETTSDSAAGSDEVSPPGDARANPAHAESADVRSAEGTARDGPLGVEATRKTSTAERELHGHEPAGAARQPGGAATTTPAHGAPTADADAAVGEPSRSSGDMATRHAATVPLAGTGQRAAAATAEDDRQGRGGGTRFRAAAKFESPSPVAAAAHAAPRPLNSALSQALGIAVSRASDTFTTQATAAAESAAPDQPADSLAAGQQRAEAAHRSLPPEFLIGGAEGPRAEPNPAPSAAQHVQLVQRVARALRTTAERGGTLRLRLNPPELGALRLEVTIEHGSMSARMEAESQMARNVLLDALPQLRERLAAQGVRVEQFQVDVGEQRTGSGLQQSSDQQSPRDPSTAGRAARAVEQPTPLNETDVEPPPSQSVVTLRQLNVVI